MIEEKSNFASKEKDNIMRVTILGTGTSGGVPQIGCNCRTCMSNNKKDKRTRCSTFIESDGGTRILIDCGPDFRQQFGALVSNDKSWSRSSSSIIRKPLIDAILITHEHYDHVGGLDDLRPVNLFNMNIYAEEQCALHLSQRLPYCFVPIEKRYPGVPFLNLEISEPHKEIVVGDLKIIPFRVMHGKLPILGFRIGKLTYITDMSYIDEEEMEYIKGSEILICNALQHKKHLSHQTIEEAIEFATKIKANETYFIHMSHYCLPHKEEENLLQNKLLSMPEADGLVMHFAFDGLTLTL